MAVPEGHNVYDVLGTVLRCTVPVMMDAEEPHSQMQRQQHQQQWGDVNVPLDYDAALALREVEEAAMAARYSATKARASSGAGSISASAAASAGGGAASREANALKADGAAAVGGYSSSAVAPASSAKTNPRLRRGGSLARANSGTASARSGVTDGAATLRDASATDDVAILNARVARAQLRASAAEAKKVRVAVGGAAAMAGTARSPTSGDGGAGGGKGGVNAALTVAQAMELLFPLTVVGGGAGGDGPGAEERKSMVSERSRAVTPSQSASPAGDGALGAAARSSAAGAPMLWQRADVAHLSRLDVVLLYQHLLDRCACEAARPRGVVCPNRERIYSDGLRELIRQITLLCPERGLLLDELAESMRKSTETYDVLLDSASQYAVRKSTERDLHQHLFEDRVTLETEVRRREHRVSEWRAKLAGLHKRFQDQQEADSKLHAEEIAYAKRANLQLVSEIKRLASEAEKAKEA